MKILLCGGGSGGHITPILAIAHEIKRQNPACRIVYVGAHGGKFSDLTKNMTSIDEVKTIYAGKFRRYHGESWFQRLTDYKTNLLNIRDFFYFTIGCLQSFFWLGRLKPNVIFLNGGYVGMPIGFAAALRKIPFITHDLDSISNLTNRVVGKWAVYNATGMPSDMYSYPKHKIRFVGIPVAPEIEPVDTKRKKELRHEIDFPEKAKMLLVTGGSLGAVTLNEDFSKIAEKLLDKFPDLYIYHQVGNGKQGVYDGVKTNKRLLIYEFIPNMFKYIGAADVVVTRGGATTIAELAVQGKASIIVPNPFLAGGHQVMNGEELQLRNAAIVLSEKQIKQDPKLLLNTIINLLEDEKQQKLLSDNIKQEAKPDAAREIAEILTTIVKNNGT